MIVLPVVGRELRVAARRVITYRIRLWAALAAMALAAWKAFSFAWQNAPVATQGRELFYTLSGLAFVYCLFIGARVTADCLSEEKREGTLGLLFLTDLTGLDVVLGKLAANSLNSLYGLLAVLPLLAMPLLLGGVTLAQFGQMVLVLLDTLVFSLSVGLFVSALSRNERKAMLGTMLAVLSPAAVPCGILFFMVFVLEWSGPPGRAEAMLAWLVPNPVYAFVWTLNLPSLAFLRLPDWSFWCSLAAVHLATWVALFVTALILPRVWKDRTRSVKPLPMPSLFERWRELTLGNAVERRALRDRLLGRNPYFWLISRDRMKPAYSWGFLVSMIAVWLWGYWNHHEVMFDFYPLAPTVILIHGFLKIWVASEVSHRLVEDQRNGALELLLSTPLTMQDIRRGQKLALLRQFGPPVLAMGALELIVFHTAVPIQTILLVLVLLIADLFTLSWVALRLSLEARSINEVLLKCFLWVLVVPWVISLAVWPAWNFVGRVLFFAWDLPEWNSDLPGRVSCWFAIGILTDLVLVRFWARPHLLARFKETEEHGLGGNSLLVPKWLACRLKTEV